MKIRNRLRRSLIFEKQMPKISIPEEYYLITGLFSLFSGFISAPIFLSRNQNK
jgi:hypothetical protein